MNKKVKNIILLIIASGLGYYAAPYLGHLYNNAFPSELNSGWIGSTESLEFIRGISLSLIFFLVTVSATWVFKKNSSSIWLVSPLILYEALVDIRHIYIPAILILVAFGISWLLQKISNFKNIKEQSS